jgi:hypothetical protein
MVSFLAGNDPGGQPKEMAMKKDKAKKAMMERQQANCGLAVERLNKRAVLLSEQLAESQLRVDKRTQDIEKLRCLLAEAKSVQQGLNELVDSAQFNLGKMVLMQDMEDLERRWKGEDNG